MTNIESLLFYILIFGVSGICMALYENQRKNIRVVFLFVALILPVLLAAFRVDVGTDYAAYKGLLEWEMNQSFLQILREYKMYETGFKIIVKIATIPRSMVFVWGILAFIPTFLIFYTLKTQYKNISISVAYMVYLHVFFSASLNIVRQYVAVAIVFWGIKFIFENKFWKYLCVVLVAMTIHRSAFIVLPFYFMWDHKKNKMAGKLKVGVISGVLCIGVVMWTPILSIVMSIVPVLNKYRYLITGNGGSNRDIFLKLVLLFIGILFYKYYKNKDERMMLFVYALFVSLIMGVTGYHTTFLKRISLYYEVPMIVLFGYLPSFFKSNGRVLVKFGIYLYALGWFVLMAFVLGQADLIPYQWR